MSNALFHLLGSFSNVKGEIFPSNDITLNPHNEGTKKQWMFPGLFYTISGIHVELQVTFRQHHRIPTYLSSKLLRFSLQTQFPGIKFRGQKHAIIFSLLFTFFCQYLFITTLKRSSGKVPFS